MVTAPNPIRTFLPARSYERILLIKPSSLGDVVHALPVLDGLRQRFPSATIDWLIASSIAPLLEGHSQITNLIPFDRRRYGRIGRSPRASTDFLRFVADLRRRRYDLAIDLQGLFRSGFLAWCSGAPVRIGFQDAREAARLFYTHRLRPPTADLHAVDKNLLIGTMLGFTVQRIRFPIELNDQDRRQAEHLLSDGGISGREPLVAIAPGARWETKLWPASRFAETINELQSVTPCDCVLLGGSEEQELCAGIAAQCQRPPVNLAGRTTLKELSALIEKADVVLCHDSAVTHLSVALDRPLVCLTGPTHPGRTGPYGRPADVMRLDLPCSPCYLRKLSQCGYDHRCMRELAVKDVVAGLQTRLSVGVKTPSATVENLRYPADSSINL